MRIIHISIILRGNIQCGSTIAERAIYIKFKACVRDSEGGGMNCSMEYRPVREIPPAGLRTELHIQSKIHIHTWRIQRDAPVGNFYERSPRDFSLVRPFTSAVRQSARENCPGNASGVFS